MGGIMETVYAIIEDDLVANTIVADQNFIDQNFPGAINITNMSPRPGIGWTYVNGQFAAPPETQPE